MPHVTLEMTWMPSIQVYVYMPAEKREYWRKKNATPERREYCRKKNATPEKREYFRKKNATPERREYDRKRNATPERREYNRQYLLRKKAQGGSVTT